MVKIDISILKEITNMDKERNIYTHPNFLARDIFWQRLEYAFDFLKKYTKVSDRILDFGGGSGVFSKALSEYYNNVNIIDLDTEEAEKIKDYFNLNNVNIINHDINEYDNKEKFDIIIATDVLEHFRNPNDYLSFFSKSLLLDGLLLVTLPTENWIYELGRKVVNKTKPIDHYYPSKQVINFLLNNGFQLVEKEFVPKYIVSIPLFEIVVFKFIGIK